MAPAGRADAPDDGARPHDGAEASLKADQRAAGGHQSPATSGQATRSRPATGDQAAGPAAGDHQRPATSHQATRLTEAQLFEIWRGRRFPAGALVTRAGVPVNVVFQGRPGRGAGLPRRGDCDCPVCAARRRRTARAGVVVSRARARSDGAYRGVILHVVFDDDTARTRRCSAAAAGRGARAVGGAPRRGAGALARSRCSGVSRATTR
jgi:hypothetical protein